MLIAGLLMWQSCDDFGDVNTNPDAVSTPTAKYIFSKAQYDAIRYNANTTKLLLGTMQYTTSYNDVAGFGSKYTASQSLQSASVFTSSFPNQINEIGEVIKAVKDDPTQINLYAVARIWRVLCFSQLTDLYGDIPYAEAGQGYNKSIFQPAYDSQESIYADMFKELDEAAQSLDESNAITFGTSDLVYDGSPAKWKKFAYSLMLRLGKRLTKVNSEDAQKWMTKAVAGGVITSYSDIAKLSYIGSGQDINKNPMALIMLNDDYIKADGVSNTEGGKYQQVFIDSLKKHDDPRLSVLAVVYENGVANSNPEVQKGMASNINGVKPADFGTYSEPRQSTVLRLASPALLFTPAETYFLLSEAALRGWYSAETAAALYEKGITEAMKQWDLISGVSETIDLDDIDAYVSAHPLNTAGTFDEQMERIYNEFWIGLFPNAQEVFANYRRTGYPNLVPNNYAGNATGGKIFRRFLYPVNEATLNTTSYNEAIERQGPDEFLTRMWWDVE